MIRNCLCFTIALLSFAATALAGPSGIVHDVVQAGLTFEPANITVAPGDTVRWTWASGFHTVTSGASCTPDGLFDMPLTSGDPIAEYVVPMESDGVIDYFCSPHCGLGMIATITVEPMVICPADVTGDGTIDVLDLLAVIAAWGELGGPADVDGSGIVDVLDLLEVISAWGPC